MEALLHFQDVSYQYEAGGEREALCHLSLSLFPGEKVALLGSNGAGKSTFFLLANGVLHPKSGEISYAGTPIGKKEKQRMTLRRHVGLVFQDPEVQLLAGTVKEEVSFGPMNLGLPEEQVQQRVEKALFAMQLTAFGDRGPQYLSGGEKRRVVIADVLAMEPDILLLDEPFSNLDPAGRENLENTLEDFHRQGMSLVIATHDVDFTWRWADRVLVFSQGTLVKDGSPEEIFQEEENLKRWGLELPMLWKVAKVLGKQPPKYPEAFSECAGEE